MTKIIQKIKQFFINQELENIFHNETNDDKIIRLQGENEI